MPLVRGIFAFFQGARFVLETRAVWWRAAIPALTTLLLTAALSAVGAHFALPWAHRTFGDGIAEELLAVTLMGVIVVVSFTLALVLARPLSGWALDGIVREQRRVLLPDERGPAKASASGLASVGPSLLALGAGAPLIVGLTVAGWVFPPAAIATVPLDVVVGALLLAWDLLDYPFALQGMTSATRARWCLRHFGSVLGFGLAASAVFAIPVLGWLALPFGVAGAARLVAQDRSRG
jgi:Etoposide-induced protein 2.4 (EI24)